MHQVVIPLERRGFGQTMRRDAWWAQPLLTFVDTRRRLSSTRRGRHFKASTTSSGRICRRSIRRCSSVTGPTAGSDRSPDGGRRRCRFRAALLILWAPGGFRFTCYYYRGAYYKAFWADPPSCAVGEPRKQYLGERSFPLILQNIHRYFPVPGDALSVRPVLRRLEGDVVHRRGTAGRRSGLASARSCSRRTRCSSSCYTLGCHSFRHLVGGVLDQLSHHPARRKGCTTAANCLNAAHMKLAWMSLFSCRPRRSLRQDVLDGRAHGLGGSSECTRRTSTMCS